MPPVGVPRTAPIDDVALVIVVVKFSFGSQIVSAVAATLMEALVAMPLPGMMTLPPLPSVKSGTVGAGAMLAVPEANE